MTISLTPLKRALLPLAFLILVSTAAHLAFSPLGFSPTDDGFTLAYSRRLLDGQMPHRDFIIIRPALSPLMHLPEVALGGDVALLISRWVVWFELAVIAWLGVSVLNRFLEMPLTPWEKVALALASLAASAHNFPLTAWHTIDGLFLCALGLGLCAQTQRRSAKMMGYLLISAAYLCKQSFALAAPLCLVALGDWRDWRAWLMVPLPGAIYGTVLALVGAWPDLALQLASQTGLIQAGLLAYLNPWTFAGVLVGFGSAHLVCSARPLPSPRALPWGPVGALLMVGLPMLGLAGVFLTGWRVVRASFGLFGLLAGAVSYDALCSKPSIKMPHRAALAALALAWSVSLSVGYNTPALAVGLLLISLVTWGRHILRIWLSPRRYTLGWMLCVSLLLVAFCHLRLITIYRDAPAHQLTMRLDGVLPGGMGIRTNPNTYAFLGDLQTAIALAQTHGQTYSIIPDCASYWALATQSNPLPIDWTQGTELSKQQLLARVVDQLTALRPHNIVLVQKVAADSLARGFLPLEDRYAVVRHVRENLELIGETTYFQLYR